ncbi:MAG: hypothetical protein R3A48_19395 [Polyangiales bacterium]
MKVLMYAISAGASKINRSVVVHLPFTVTTPRSATGPAARPRWSPTDRSPGRDEVLAGVNCVVCAAGRAAGVVEAGPDVLNARSGADVPPAPVITGHLALESKAASGRAGARSPRRAA